jgi:hypothetical protein
VATFAADQLSAIAAAEEVEIETRGGPGTPVHRVIIWVVVDGDEVYVRSVRGPRGRWFRELIATPEGALHVAGTRYPVRAELAADDLSIERCSRALERKYARDPALRTMLRAETLPTTIRLEPRSSPDPSGSDAGW